MTLKPDPPAHDTKRCEPRHKASGAIEVVTTVLEPSRREAEAVGNGRCSSGAYAVAAATLPNARAEARRADLDVFIVFSPYVVLRCIVQPMSAIYG
ncbi:MAG: hypothetical protein H6872_11220 [Methylobacteriaceae bacterium]|nr:hypothetical protein [Methylobacteriaceae bacterium]